MAETSWPFENADTSETQYSYLLRELHEPGVVGEYGSGGLAVSPGTGLTVTIAVGRALARGFVYAPTSPVTVTLATAGATARVDRIVVRFDPTANAATAVALTGATAEPSPTQTDSGIFELPLAAVAVGANVTSLSAGDITDERVFLGGRVGVWSTATRPGTAANPTPPVKGRTLGYNFTSSAWEYWNGTTWVNLIPPTVTWSTLSGKPTTSTLDLRTIYVSDSAPSAANGVNGDIWLEY